MMQNRREGVQGNFNHLVCYGGYFNLESETDKMNTNSKIGLASLNFKFFDIPSYWNKNVDIIVSGYNHFALIKMGLIACFGSNLDGECDSPSNNIQFRSFSFGDRFSCSLLMNGEVKCWGRNNYNQLMQRKHFRKPVFYGISSGGYHSCGLTVGNGITCWGDNSLGQLDSGLTCDNSGGAQGGAENAKNTSQGRGGGQGQSQIQSQYPKMPTNTPMKNESEQAIGMVSRFSHSMMQDYGTLACGRHHSCVFDDAKSVTCWGSNAYGQCNVASAK
eukprot:Mrub_03093.p1 GENE.Mrub_03093~~Mrub_03093.p1  ORF type:complete len:274 (+),score=55.55 Mrub_03093:610-1431(+)